ncbi:uncharacterized protein LOC111343846 isoform X1 [Stylophora pistillata]|uniref:uncharacterized protein LOC111343846 isoform X1 n=1 Tax=Stylophora pistillata TaxID=50429 RepID=UPI000C0463EF|nr:uncharacterized protein LOC111343846 isoform X1 [Stylophora pistillata]
MLSLSVLGVLTRLVPSFKDELNMVHVKRPASCCLLFIHVFLIGIVVKDAGTNVINDCDNTNSCLETYPDIYYALASDENSFKIESALYPLKKPSSVRVFVNLYGKNGSNSADNSTSDVTNYTWSLNCLYATFPAVFLEFLSLGSILVTPRTQELNIKIPYFCCNVSTKDRRRMTEDVLASLQDLAVNPSLRDARMNSAQCVTEGHFVDMEATGRSHYLRALLWCSIISDMLLSPVIFYFIWAYLEVSARDERSCKLCSEDATCCCFKFGFCEEKPLIRSVTFVSYFLLVIETLSIFAVVLTSSVYSIKGNIPADFYAIFAVIALESFALLFHCCVPFKNLKPRSTFCFSFCRRSSVMMTINLVLYHFYWVTIGIMINPIWGLSILLITALFIVALFVAIYNICNVDHCKSTLFLQRLCICSAGFLGLCFAVAGPALAGRSFYGGQTADDFLKTTLLSVIGLASWLYFKSRKRSSDSSQCIEAVQEAAAAAGTVLGGNETDALTDGAGKESILLN